MSEPDKVVITGVGVVSPVGIGKDTFWEAILNKTSGVKKISKFDTKGFSFSRAAEIIDFSFEDYVNDNRFRRVADVSGYALVSVILATKDAGLETFDYKSTSLIMGITHGAMNMSRRFEKGFLIEGEASPFLFPDSVLNAPAGNISVYLGIKGASHTLIGDSPISVRAFSFAIDMLMSGRTDLVIVCATEELDRVCSYSYARLNYMMNEMGSGPHEIDKWSPFNKQKKGFVIGEGAGAVILERKSDAVKRGSNIYAEICKGNACVFLDNNYETIANTISESIKKGIVGPEMVNYISIGSNGSALDRLESNALKTIFQECTSPPLLGSIRPNIGEAFSATGIMQVITASLIIKNGILPPNLNTNDIDPEWENFIVPEGVIKKPINTILINTIGIDKSFASIIIKHPL